MLSFFCPVLFPVSRLLPLRFSLTIKTIKLINNNYPLSEKQGKHIEKTALNSDCQQFPPI